MSRIHLFGKSSEMSEEQLFSVFATFDKDKARKKLVNAARSILLTMEASGGQVPDYEGAHDTIAHTVGLPDGRSYRFLRDSMIQTGLIRLVATPFGGEVQLTEAGEILAEDFRIKLLAVQGITQPRKYRGPLTLGPSDLDDEPLEIEEHDHRLCLENDDALPG